MAPRSAPNAIRIPHLARAQADHAGDDAIDAERHVAVHRLHVKNRLRSQKEPGPWLAIVGIVGDVRGKDRPLAFPAGSISRIAARTARSIRIGSPMVRATSNRAGYVGLSAARFDNAEDRGV
jgi:hypothetical protein